MEEGPQLGGVLAQRARLSGTDLSLVSWLEALDGAQFTLPFQQRELDLKFEPLK